MLRVSIDLDPLTCLDNASVGSVRLDRSVIEAPALCRRFLNIWKGELYECKCSDPGTAHSN